MGNTPRSRWIRSVAVIAAAGMVLTACGSSSDSGTTAYPVIQYSYQVGGQAYQSNKYAPGPEIGGTGAHKIVARYPVGAQVMVFYNPQNPAEAVLERKAPALWLFWLLLVIFDCTLCGVVPLLWYTMK